MPDPAGRPPDHEERGEPRREARRARPAPAWVRLCDLAGRLAVLGGLVYAGGRTALSLARLAAQAVSGSRPEPGEITAPLQGALQRGWTVLPLVAGGAVLILLAAMARLARGRAASGDGGEGEEEGGRAASSG